MLGWDSSDGSGPATTPCAPISARIGAPSSSALARRHDHHGRGAVGDLRRRPGRHRAVGGERRAQPGQARRGGAGAHALVLGDRDRVAPALRHRHVDDLVVEQALLAAPSAARSWLIAEYSSWSSRVSRLLLAVEVGRVTHPAQVERAVQRVVRGRVDDLVVAVAVAGAGAGQQVRAVGHRLHAARDDDVELADADQLVRHRDGVQPRQAHLVDGQGGDVHRDAALDRGLPGGDLPGPGLDHVPHDHVVDLAAGDADLLQGRGDREPAEVHRGEPLERTRQLADGRPRTPDDHRTRHGRPPLSRRVRVTSSSWACRGR